MKLEVMWCAFKDRMCQCDCFSVGSSERYFKWVKWFEGLGGDVMSGTTRDKSFGPHDCSTMAEVFAKVDLPERRAWPESRNIELFHDFGDAFRAAAGNGVVRFEWSVK